MKYLKYFESELEDIRSEYGYSSESNPEYLPGFEGGTMDPDDDDPFDWGDRVESEKQIYKKFLVAAKNKYFKETENEIIIDLKGLDGTFCISVQNYTKYITKFLTDELSGKYISNGFVDWYNSNPDEDYINIEGIIDKIVVEYPDTFNCNSAYNIKLKDKKTNKGHTMCRNIIVIDKLKSSASKFNI